MASRLRCLSWLGGWKYLKQVQRKLVADGTGDPGGQKLAALCTLGWAVSSTS